MHLHFRLLPMMELRNSPGKVLDRVAGRHEAFIVERNGVQMACLVPVSFVMPDIQNARINKELDTLETELELYRLRINDDKELELVFPREGESKEITLTIRLPHGYPSSCPRIFAEPVEEKCPERWHDKSLCTYGAMQLWNPAKHDVAHALGLARQWLNRYDAWLRDGKWGSGGNDE